MILRLRSVTSLHPTIENPVKITVKKFTIGAASEDAKAICSLPLTSLLTESAAKHTEQSAVNRGVCSKTTRRRPIPYLPQGG